MLFQKTNVVFFGVSGYIAYKLERESSTRIMIVLFSAPMRGRNTVSIITADERERNTRALRNADDVYYYFKRNNTITQIHKKMPTAMFQSSHRSNRESTNPCINDEFVNVRVECSISGDHRATLEVKVYNS